MEVSVESEEQGISNARRPSVSKQLCDQDENGVNKSEGGQTLYMGSQGPLSLDLTCASRWKKGQGPRPHPHYLSSI